MSSLKDIVDEYRIEIDGVSFWTPYPYEELNLTMRREVSGERPPSIPFKGRGAPDEIKSCLQEKLKYEEVELDEPEQFRAYMAKHNLGVECSGFAFYVLDTFLSNQYSERLADHLYKSRDELLSIYDNPHLTPPENLERTTVKQYPDWVSLSRIQADWGNKPRNIVESSVFSNEGSTVAVNIDDVAPADIIAMRGHEGIDHHVVVVSVNESKIHYAHSGGRHGRAGYYGGVDYGTILLEDSTTSIAEQQWSDKLMLKAHTFDDSPVRRLRFLTDDE